MTIAAGCGVQARSASSGDAAPAPAPAPADPVAGHALSARPAFARGRTPPQLASQRGTRDYEYVFVDGEAYVYDVGRGQRLVQTISLPGITSIRGVGM
ncbi:MAG: hypothetical protein ACRDMJ_15920, partial [Solirubrobacteraceae bacterium]